MVVTTAAHGGDDHGRRSTVIAVRIPHRAPVHCLADSAACITHGIIVRATVQMDSPGALAGVVRPGWLIEVAAQACAAAGVVDASAAIRRGMLVSVKDWQWHCTMPVGVDMVVQVVGGAALGTMIEYRCTLTRDNQCVAEGSLVVIHQ